MAFPIMIQGTMSNAGKSLISAGLCRVFKQDGYRVSPFKSQNMALNSFVTSEGREIGRAQAVQAEACGIEPSVYMNPILLKPTTDMGSQVIVNGKAVGNMTAADYFKYKKRLIPEILAAYEKLAENSDIIVIEGAGSPAEINLKNDDIVNMGLAKMLKSPVLLAGDIDRGGVFAQLYGTVMLLEKEERELIKGVLINKFRGDIKILEPGLKEIEKLCSLKVAGVIPYVDVDIEDEDSLSGRLNRREGKELIDIAVIRLPKISNFTDMNSIDIIEGISVRYVDKSGLLKNPDMVVVPGSKNTIKDLIWLRESGIEAEIKKLSQKGMPIIGICGGYQMLGNTIKDPFNAEGGGEIDGMGLLDINTEFLPEKNQRQTKGRIISSGGDYKFLSGLFAEGYEIHMGRTSVGGRCDKINIECGKDIRTVGACRGNVLGLYIHGFFDSESVLRGVKDFLFKRAGIEGGKSVMSWKEYKETQYNYLADVIRKSVDMEYIYSVMGVKK